GAGAEIVVTGRTTDAALTLGPLVHELGWAWDDWDRLAAGTVAGHVLECGAQATGGNLTDWRRVTPLDVGYPIADVASDGGFVVRKSAGTGGRVSRATVTEQLLYEIANPGAYLTPDVSADFRALDVVDVGPDRVAVTGARGTPPPDSLKVTVVVREGWRAVGLALLSGPDIRGKADRLAEMLWHRLGVDFADRRAELIGYRSCWGSAAPDVEPNEGVFRAAVRDPDRGKVERFAHTLLGFAVQGPPGLGVFGGRPEVQESYAYWPALVPRELVRPRIEILRGETRVARELPSGPPGIASGSSPPSAGSFGEGLAVPDGACRRVPLRRIAYARSGDKGDHANIGVAARSPLAYAFLRRTLDRPEVGTALDVELVTRLAEALAAAAGDPTTRVVVITGAGKSFSAGADLNYMRKMREAGVAANLADARRTQAVFAGIATLARPVVARVNGHARGGGVGLLAAADLVVAAAEATFAFTEVRLGIVPAMIAPFVIARVGPARALRLFLNAQTLRASAALA